MLAKISKDLEHYLPLLGIFVASILGFYFFSYDKLFQIVISVAVSVSYFVWGLVHHHVHEDLDVGVVIEYFAVAALGLIVMISLVSRG